MRLGFEEHKLRSQPMLRLVEHHVQHGVGVHSRERNLPTRKMRLSNAGGVLCADWVHMVITTGCRSNDWNRLLRPTL